MDDATLYVTGLKELRAALRRVEPDLLPVMRDKLKGAADSIVVDAQRRVPLGRQGQSKRTRSGGSRPLPPGSAKGSIRAVAGGNKLYIVAGGQKAPYYGWLDFGGVLRPVGKRRNTQRRPVIKKGRYLYPAIGAHSKDLTVAVSKAFDEVAHAAGLD